MLTEWPLWSNATEVLEISFLQHLTKRLLESIIVLLKSVWEQEEFFGKSSTFFYLFLDILISTLHMTLTFLLAHDTGFIKCFLCKNHVCKLFLLFQNHLKQKPCDKKCQLLSFFLFLRFFSTRHISPDCERLIYSVALFYVHLNQNFWTKISNVQIVWSVQNSNGRRMVFLDYFCFEWP